MGWRLTIDDICKDAPVEAFSVGHGGEWQLVLPLDELAVVLLRAANEGRVFDRLELTGDGMPTYSMSSIAIASCTTGADVLDVAFVGTPG